MAGRKYLQQRGNCWYVRVPRPPLLWGKSSEFVCSLHTPDLRTAQALRDKYLLPILAETAAAGMIGAIARAMAGADESVARQLAELRVNLSGLEGKGLTLREAADQFLSYLRSSGAYAPASIRKYSSSFDAVCHILGPECDAEGLSKADATRFRDTLLAMPVGWQRRREQPAAAASGERTVSARSVSRVLVRLRRLFRWLIDEGRVLRRDNPFEGIGVARVVANHKRCPTLDEAHALMSLPRPKAIPEPTWRMMPVLARYTGCRAGELAQLRPEDVVSRQDIRCLRITGRGGRRLKTEGSERLIPVADKLALHLDELLASGEGSLLNAGDYEAADGTVKYAHLFLKHWNRRVKVVAPDLSFHCWRVYANDAMATAGVDILDRERLLGHKSERTQAAYTPQNLRRLKAAVDRIP